MGRGGAAARVAGFTPQLYFIKIKRNDFARCRFPRCRAPPASCTFGFRLGFSWFSWLQLLGRPWSACGAAFLFFVAGALLLWWCSACLSVLAALPSLSTRVHTPGLRGVACPRLRSSCPRGTDQLGESTRVHTEMAWPVVQLRLSRGGGPTQPVDAGTYTGSPRRGSSTSAELVSARHGSPGRVDHRSRRDDVAAPAVVDVSRAAQLLPGDTVPSARQSLSRRRARAPGWLLVLDNLADRTVWCVRVRPPELIRWAARRVGSRVPVD